jgi:two-component system cell cycle sensor histidine kinase/response regulator CckA
MAENLVRPVEESGSWAGSGTILLVEDDDSLRELLVATLQSASYRILEANTAEAAIELITAHKREVQLLLSDVVMPRMSGVSLPKLKAIFMSGYAPEMLSRRDPLPRNSLFIQKPFSKETLLSTIHGALR